MQVLNEAVGALMYHMHAGSRFGKSEAELLVAQQSDEVSSCQQ